jgi:hypothetical protein
MRKESSPSEFEKGRYEMDYWIYENWPDPKARIHRSDCAHCNAGQGTHPGASDRNGKWEEPYSTLAAAKQAASRTGLPVSLCAHCKP